MTATRHLSVEAALSWRSAHAIHTDRRFFELLDMSRDSIPADLGARLARAAVGETVRADIDAGVVTDPFDRARIRPVKPDQFGGRLPDGTVLEPRVGRFYPRTFLQRMPEFFAGDRRPFRVLARAPDALTVDLNHPFAAFGAELEATVVAELEAREQRDGRGLGLPQELTDRGPGMQAALAGVDTDFFSGAPFARMDERDDRQFYANPRLVPHLDSTAIGRVTEIYARLLRPRSAVFDLMSSWSSHLPDGGEGLRVTGLGLNADELAHNGGLAERVVHDLNAEPRLPFPDARFDAAVCTVSVEYLIHPVEVFREVARVLKPGAPFVLTFSERWFPTKVVALWAELHPFERMALVVDYFRRAGGFGEFATDSIRGLPRPAGDKYSGQLPYSDPVYAVWGRRTA